MTEALVQEPTLATSEQRTFSRLITFDGTDRIFVDHFPGNPIVPAFMQLERIRTLAAQSVGTLPERMRVKSAKFTKPIRPDRPLTVTFIATMKEGTCRFTIQDHDEIVTQGELAL